MINAEKYLNELRELRTIDSKYDYNIAVDSSTKKPILCSNLDDCDKCEFYKGKTSCDVLMLDWLLEEYKEHPKYKLTQAEYDFLNALLEEKSLFLARDESGDMFLYLNKPMKDNHGWYDYESDSLLLDNSLFKFVKWTDKNPHNIQDILDDCEVLEND